MQNIRNTVRDWWTCGVRRAKGLKWDSKFFVPLLIYIFAGLFVFLFVFLLVVIFVVLFIPNPEWFYPFLGLSQENETSGLSPKNEALRFLGFGIGGTLLALGAVISYIRAKAFEDTARAQVKANKNQVKANETQEQGLRQERLKNAIEHLESSSASVRLGGAYELFHLAKDTRDLDQTEDLSQTALDILCAHIRHTTSGKEYRAEYGSGPSQDDKEKREDNPRPSQDDKEKEGNNPRPSQDDKEKREDNPRPSQDDKEKEGNNPQPSEEIQSLLNLLFVQNYEVFKDRNINLRGAFLRGADLVGARLHKANLERADLRGTNLVYARLHKANLERADLQGANLTYTRLRKANLERADLQGARLARVNLRGAWLLRADLQGAELWSARLQYTHLFTAKLQGANLLGAQLQGAYLSEAYLQGANLERAYLQGASLQRSHLEGANLLGAYLQFTDLFGAQLQAANLFRAQLQAANLFRAQLQGANLMLAELQGVNLPGAGLRDVDSGNKRFIFEDNIRQQIGKESDLSRITFSGGLTQENVDSIVESMPNDEHKKRLLERLMPHVGKPASSKLPQNSGAITDPYTEEEAEKWIAEYNKIMSYNPPDPTP